MSLVFNKNTNIFRKCGEITTRGEKEFFLVCIFCTDIFLKLEDFISHIKVRHLKGAFEEKNLFDNVIDIIDESYNASISKKDNLPELKWESNFCSSVESRSSQDHNLKDIEWKSKNLQPEEFSSDPLSDLNLDSADEKPMEIHIEKMETSDNERHINVLSDEELRNPFDEFKERFRYSEVKHKKDNGSSNGSKELEVEDCFKLIEEKDSTTLAIIAEYEKHPLLWNEKKIPIKKSKAQRVEALNEIAINVNKLLNTNLEWKTVHEHIKKLRKKYCTALQKQKEAELDGEPYSSYCYTNQTNFLSNPKEKNQNIIHPTRVYKKTKSVLPFSNLSDEQNIKLITIYKKFPCLWDLQHISYRFKNRRQEALVEMQKLIKDELGLNLTQNQLQRKIFRIRHACSQDKHRKIELERMNKPFKPICKYYENIKYLEDNVGPFKCIECKEILNAADQYQIHKSTHDGSMPFTCPICNRGFMKVGNCTVHLRRHTRDYQFECKICKKRFATSTDMSVHMRRHTGEKPYFCEVCGQSFRTWTFFDSHMRRHQKRPLHKCNICARTFYESGKLTEHMKAHLNVRDKVCNLCGKAFTSNKYLRQHKQIHAENKKYVCKLCGKHFAQYAGLSGHMKSHGTTLIACGGSGTVLAINDSDAVV